MPFCIKCGRELADSANFCAHCGTAVPAVSHENPEQRKLVYEGEIHKCPSCGEVLPSLVSVCPSCGYEFRGASVSHSVREFALRLSDNISDEQKVSLIRAFPIPNTKEDIFEFMILASSNFDAVAHTSTDSLMQKDVADAWLVKFEQGYQKAQLLFHGNPDFSKIQDIYDRTQAAINNATKKQEKKKTSSALTQNISVFLGLLLLIIAVIMNKTGNDSTQPEAFGCLILIVSACFLKRQQSRFLGAGIAAFSGLAALALGEFLSDGSVLQASGGLILIIVAINSIRCMTSKKK